MFSLFACNKVMLSRFEAQIIFALPGMNNEVATYLLDLLRKKSLTVNGSAVTQW